jgi:excinuclease ABC subunit A
LVRFGISMASPRSLALRATLSATLATPALATPATTAAAAATSTAAAAITARTTRGRGVELGAAATGIDDTLRQHLALVDPHLHADAAEGGLGLGEAVVDVGAQGVQRHAAVGVVLRARHLRTAEAATALHLHALGAGAHGGEIVAIGSPEEIAASPSSITGNYLSGRTRIEIPAERRSPNGRAILIRGASANNLKEIDVRFPLGLLTVVTGVSGSGKSTLVGEILYRALARALYRSPTVPGAHTAIEGLEFVDKIIEIDQSPIGRTPRSNPATYTGLFTPIRELYAMLPESRERGYQPGRFSFNVKGGRCEACQGDGLKRIEMNFLPDVYVTCEVCRGQRYNRQTLDVRYQGHNIAQLLEMTVAEALPLLENHSQVRQKLQTLHEVGLGYLQLGQSATTLSGGEAQRIKLARELSRRATGRTIYLLDEPTTGLHFEDVRKLLEVLQRLVSLGNSVIVIEHNLDIIKSADWVIDLGPEGGEAGGRLLAEGPPEVIARCRKSHTGQSLRPFFPASR